MRSSLRKYGLLATMLAVIFGQSAFALIHKVSSMDCVSNPCFLIDKRPTPSAAISGSKDTITQENQPIYAYLETRVSELKSNKKGKDTIQKSSDIHAENLNKNASLAVIKSKADNNFITRNLFSLIIKENQPLKELMGVKSTRYFEPYTGRIISKIHIQQLDVFGPTFEDTTKQASGWLERTGNTFHAKTTEHKLRNQLLFNTGETVDPQLMADNEKIIRDLPYIQDVAIILSRSKQNANEVDVLVLVKEKFEYGLSGNLSSTSTAWRIADQNMFGIGHQLLAGISYDLNEKPQWGGTFDYVITDVWKKFISTGIGYTNTYRKKSWDVFIEKNFIASKVDWAGGVSIERTYSDYFLTPYSYTKLDTAASYLYSDFWYGQLIKNKNIYSKLGNLIVAGRYLHRNYYNKTADATTNSFFRNHNFIVGSLAISKRHLFKNNRIYGYGITEDIPYGRYAEVALGLDNDDHQVRPYFHIRYTKANILNSGGYFKWQVGIGGYIGDSRIEQGAFQLNTNYFSKLVYINRHPYRFFINMELLSGINRFKEEYLVINRRFGLRDFFSLDTKGINRLKVNIESVRFWGWDYDGFRFANYFFADAAFLSDDMHKIFKQDFYSGIGFGIRVHNESLIFNVLELRLSWFPIAPKDNSQFIFNAFGQPKARFDDFLGGKPQEILYQ